MVVEILNLLCPILNARSLNDGTQAYFCDIKGNEKLLHLLFDALLGGSVILLSTSFPTLLNRETGRAADVLCEVNLASPSIHPKAELRWETGLPSMRHRVKKEKLKLIHHIKQMDEIFLT